MSGLVGRIAYARMGRVSRPLVSWEFLSGEPHPDKITLLRFLAANLRILVLTYNINCGIFGSRWLKKRLSKRYLETPFGDNNGGGNERPYRKPHCQIEEDLLL